MKNEQFLLNSHPVGGLHDYKVAPIFTVASRSLSSTGKSASNSLIRAWCMKDNTNMLKYQNYS